MTRSRRSATSENPTSLVKTFPGSFESLPEIADLVRAFAGQVGLDDAAIYQVEMAVDEACSNIIEHGYAGMTPGTIQVTCRRIAEGLEIQLQDHGHPHQPLKVPNVDPAVPLKRRKAGKMGLVFIHQYFDMVEYSRTPQGDNVLRLVKYLKRPPRPLDQTDNLPSLAEIRHTLIWALDILPHPPDWAERVQHFLTRLLGGRAALWFAKPAFPFPGDPEYQLLPDDVPADSPLLQAASGSMTLYLVDGVWQATAPAPHPQLQGLIIPFFEKGQTIAVVQYEAEEGTILNIASASWIVSFASILETALISLRQLRLRQWLHEQLRLVHEVTAQTASVLDVDQYALQVVELIQRTFKYYFVSLFTLDAESETLHLRAAVWPDQDQQVPHVPPIPLGVGLVGDAAKSLTQVVIPDVSLDPRYQRYPALPETRSEACLPVRIGNRLLGVLDVQSEQAHDYDDLDLLVLESLTNSIAVSLNTATLYSDLTKRMNEMEFLSQVSHVLNSILDHDQLLAEVVHLIQDRYRYPHVHIFSVHSGRRLVIYEAGSGPHSAQLRDQMFSLPLDAEEGIIPEVARTGKIIVSNDVSKDKRFRPPVIPPFSIRSELALPLNFGGNTLAVLDIQSEQLAAFSASDVSLFRSLAPSVAVAYRNAGLYRSEQWRRQLADSFRETAYEISGNLDFQAVVDFILDRIDKNLPCKAAAIWILNQSPARPAQQGRLELVSVMGVTREKILGVLEAHPDLRARLFACLDQSDAYVRMPEDPPEILGHTLELGPSYSALTIRLVVNGIPAGLLTLADDRTGRYGAQTRMMAGTYAAYLGVAIQNERFRVEMVESELGRQEVRLAREIQKSFLPETVKPPRGWDIDQRWVSAREVSGDFYDFIPINDNCLGIVIADVSGKGIPAALYMTVSRTLIRSHTQESDSPADVLESVNRLLFNDSSEAMFITAFFAILNFETGELTYVNAGHNRPLVYRAKTGEVQALPRGQPALAVYADQQYQNLQAQLGKGDLLLLYTDGLEDMLSPLGKAFGQENVYALFEPQCCNNARSFLARVDSALDQWRGETAVEDDVTLIAVSRTR